MVKRNLLLLLLTYVSTCVLRPQSHGPKSQLDSKFHKQTVFLVNLFNHTSNEPSRPALLHDSNVLLFLTCSLLARSLLLCPVAKGF